MDRAACPFARFPVDRLVRDAGLKGKTTIRCGRIADQQDISRQHLPKALMQLLAVTGPPPV
jgi:hypothetical protein